MKTTGLYLLWRRDGGRKKKKNQHPCCKKDGARCNKKRKNSLLFMSNQYECVDLSDMDFSVATVENKTNKQKKKPNISYETQFYLYKLVKDKKTEVCGSKGRTSVINRGIRMRKQRSAYKKKINSNKQCKQEYNKWLTSF